MIFTNIIRIPYSDLSPKADAKFNNHNLRDILVFEKMRIRSLKYFFSNFLHFGVELFSARLAVLAVCQKIPSVTSQG